MIYFFVLAVSFIIVYLITPNIRYLGLKFSVVDGKNHRKIHKKVITKLGGLAIYFGFLGGMIIVAVFNPVFFRVHILQIMGLIICASLILILGIYDDFQGSNAITKLFIQITVALVLIKIGFKLEKIYIPGLIDLNLGILSVPLTMLWLIGITNAINLIDGLDGLASGIIVIVSAFLCLYGFLFKQFFIVYTSLALIGANLAFLKYNFFPAKIFMGDTGSLFLGFIIGSLAIYRPGTEDLNNLLFLPSVIILILPIIDTFMAVIRRLARKQKIFTGDFSHLHHYYIKLGFSQIQTVTRFYLITIFLGCVSLFFVLQLLIFK